MKFPPFEEFKEQAANHNLVALCTSLSWDHETAVSLASRFEDREDMILLESATHGAGHMARHTYVAFDSIWKLNCTLEAYDWIVKDPIHKVDHRVCDQTKLNGIDPLKFVEELTVTNSIAELTYGKWKNEDFEVSKLGGAFGYMGYDLAGLYEPTIGQPPRKELGLPDFCFMLPRFILVYDQLRRSLIVVTLFAHNLKLGEAQYTYEHTLEDLYKTLLKDTSTLLKGLQNSHTPRRLQIKQTPIDYDQAKSAVVKDEFLRRVERCMEAIRSGEVFQIQIGNRLSVETMAEPFDVFRHLRMLNPSPYMFFMRMGEDVVLGASPEMMVVVQGDKVAHRPIAGTRKKTWDVFKDRQMRQELLTDPKERAEHVMLVDLSRNDLGRVCIPGTVEVDELMVVEEYSHVFHMVSQVDGTLQPGVDASDAMRVSFPNGTVSGAPKVRAMELIYELEDISREYYAGSLGMLCFNGDLKTTILIRTLHMANGVASTQASAGIVFDSVPELEWQETRNKMAACLTAMQNTE